MSEVNQYLDAIKRREKLAEELRKEGRKYEELGKWLQAPTDRFMCPEEKYPIVFVLPKQTPLGPFKPMEEIIKKIRAYNRAVDKERELCEKLRPDDRRLVPKPV